MSKPKPFLMIILSSIFKQSRKEITHQYQSIYSAQKEQSGSPNYFYGGKTYILIKGLSVKPLHKDLRSWFDSTSTNNIEIEDSYKKLQYLLFDFLRDSTASDLYTLFPKDAHYFLEGVIYPESDCKLPDSVEEIRDIIREQLLNSLL